MDTVKRIRLRLARARQRLLFAIVAVVLVCPVDGKPRKDPEAEALAQTLFTEAQNLRAAFDEQSSRNALEKLATARSVWQKTGDVKSQVRAWETTAEILIVLSDYHAALKSYQEELRLSKNSAD